MTDKNFTIDGGKILLRPISDSDTASIIKWRNSENVRSHFVFRVTLTEEMHRDWLETRVAAGEVVQFIIYSKDKCKDIGSVYLRDIRKEQGIAEYGIFIGEDDCRGLGYGCETCGLILNYSWDVLKLKSVFLRVFRDNTPAISSYSKNGFVPIPPEDLGLYVDLDNIDTTMLFMKTDAPEGQ